MDDAELRAREIYHLLKEASADRPFAFNSMEEMKRKMAEWFGRNDALKSLVQASPEVQLEFLRLGPEYLRSEGMGEFRVTSSYSDALLVVIEQRLEPVPPEIIVQLLRETLNLSFYSPFDKFLELIRPEQVNDEIRNELRKHFHLHAPTATGEIDKRSKARRDKLSALMRVEGEKEIPPGLGPWSMRVFEDIESLPDELQRIGLKALLEHCKSLQQTAPSRKWMRTSTELWTALGPDVAADVSRRWLALGPTPGESPEARSPIEDSDYQKGVLWAVSLDDSRENAMAIGDFALACLRKIPMIGAVSQKVGFAGVTALGEMKTPEAIAQLTRLRTKVRYSVAKKLISKALSKAAERLSMSVDEVEDLAVDDFSLSTDGTRQIQIGDSAATLHLDPTGRVAVAWRNESNKLVKSPPSHIKKAFPEEVREVTKLAKRIEQAWSAQKARIEHSMTTARKVNIDHWLKYRIEHALLGLIGRRLIWIFSSPTSESSAIHRNGRFEDSFGAPVDISQYTHVRIWHPLASTAEEVQRWRERIFELGIRQPIRQAFREFYSVTDAERETKLYSNRFAGTVLRQHQLASLCRERDWEYRLMGAHFDGFNVPRKHLPDWNLRAEFYVDIPSDRNSELKDSAMGEESGSGINLFVISDQVRFYLDKREVSVDEVPALAFSEIMRDVDLFTSVSAVGKDETWTDQGDRGTGLFYSAATSPQELSQIADLRADIVARLIPSLGISERATVNGHWLTIQGQLGTYKINLQWGGAFREREKFPKYLTIPTDALKTVKLDFDTLPIDIDHRTELILRKALVLAHDWKIKSPDLIRQLMDN